MVSILTLKELDAYIKKYQSLNDKLSPSFKKTKTLHVQESTYFNDYYENPSLSRDDMAVDSSQKSSESVGHQDIDDFISLNKQSSFNEILFMFIDQKKIPDTEVYKHANIDRRLFSKIRSNKNYHPKKQTVLALAISLELSLNDASKLLKAAGYALNDRDTLDLVIRFCIEKSRYNILEVNYMLDHRGTMTL